MNWVKSQQFQLRLSLLHAFLFCMQLVRQLLNSILSLSSTLKPHFMQRNFLALLLTRRSIISLQLSQNVSFRFDFLRVLDFQALVDD